MTVKVGIYDLYESGSIICNAKEHIDFTISESFILRILFEQNLSIPNAKLEAELEEGKILKLKFINYFGSTNRSHTAPLPIGQFNNRKLYFNYSITHSIGAIENMFAMSYVFMLGENV